MKFGEWIKDTRTWRRSAAVAAVLILAVGWITVDVLFMPRKKPPKTIEIPNFCGLALEDLQAEEWLDIDIEYRYDENTPAGIVFDQAPTGGSRRRLADDGEHYRVTVVVSLGRESILLPQVVGRDIYEVATELRNLGLVVNTEMQSSPREAGKVLGSEPRAGESVPKGATVTLTVSQGEKQSTVQVPQLCGLTRADALIRLWLCQLNVGEVVEAPSSAPVGTVFRQSHAAGTVVLPGTKITIYISQEYE
jgi:serine/threonine-protein kinase